MDMDSKSKERTLANLDGFLDNEHDKGCSEGYMSEYVEYCLIPKIEKGETLTAGDHEFIGYVNETWGDA